MSKTYRFLLTFVLTSAIMLTLTACKPQDKKPSTNTQTETTTNDIGGVSYERVIAVIEDVDYNERKFHLINLETDTKFTLTSGPGVELADEYGDLITVNEFNKGDIVRAKYESETMKPESINITAENWEFRNISGLVFDDESKIIRSGANVYTYTDNLMIIQDGEMISKDKLSDVDEITIKGYKSHIWVIEVSNGHGTLTLKNHDYFIDGIIEVGLESSHVITANFSIDAPVGVISLRIEKGSFSEEKDVMIERNKEYVLDLSYLDSVVPKVGKVEFKFNQEAVNLYINGRATSYGSSLELPYGDYTIKATKPGFEDYNEVFRLDAPQLTKTITLTEKTDSNSSGNNGNGNNGNSNNGGKNNGNNNNNGNKDGAQNQPSTITLSILGPIGVEIYVDGVSKGTLPNNISLAVGTHKISLREAGYVSTEHTIEVYEGMSTIFSFPELAQNP